jgi:hypothetical protein
VCSSDLEIKRLSISLPRGWVLAYKNHPLAQAKVEISGGLCLDDYHINDILSASDCIGVFNSGVGVLAAAFEKPVYFYGKCFYAADGLNRTWISCDAISRDLIELWAVDREKLLRFFFHLIENVYSFATVKTTVRRDTKGITKTILEEIGYSSIKFPARDRIYTIAPNFDLGRSLLFEPYSYSSWLKRSSAKSSKGLKSAPTKSVSKPAPAKPGPRTAKAAKLRRNPHAFFRDARNPLLRRLKFFFSR